MRFSIEEIDHQHLENVTHIERQVFLSPWTRESLAAALEKSFGSFGAFVGDQIVGYIFFRLCTPVAEILNLAVSKAFQTQGCGSSLLEYFHKTMEINGVHEIHLEVASKNQPARALYEKFSYQTVGSRIGYYTEPKDDAILMTRRLSFGCHI